jgi:hypothetical protein
VRPNAPNDWRTSLYLFPSNSPVTRVDPSGMTEPWPEIVRVKCQDFASSNLCCEVEKPASVGGRWTAAARCTCGDSDDPCRVYFYSGLGCTGKVLATAKGMFCLEAHPPKFYCIGCGGVPATVCGRAECLREALCEAGCLFVLCTAAVSISLVDIACILACTGATGGIGVGVCLEICLGVVETPCLVAAVAVAINGYRECRDTCSEPCLEKGCLGWLAGA